MEKLILAIETSCDETACAVTRGREVLSNIISSQIEIHKRFGGVVPEIASRNHVTAIDSVVKEALSAANVELKDISAIAVTVGAGLLGALLVGVSYAKALAYALKIPLIGIDHIKGHVCANLIGSESLDFPFITLLASGGHTAILRVNGYLDMEVLGQTVDDAAGEAFDKVARVLGLPYPGGPQVEAIAKSGNNNIPMPRPFKNEPHLNFSYSGLKTAVINYVNTAKMKNETYNPADLACSFQTAAVGMLVENAIKGAKRVGLNKIALAGGVGANGFLREALTDAGNLANIEIFLPPKHLCTDNAAMIGIAAYRALEEGVKESPLTLDANPNL
jgi:N6-L-threonylcarbamoyladenine synthase